MTDDVNFVYDYKKTENINFIYEKNTEIKLS
jgi:hypothetical protein